MAESVGIDKMKFFVFGELVVFGLEIIELCCLVFIVFVLEVL